jgi:hypothetical protein
MESNNSPCSGLSSGKATELILTCCFTSFIHIHSIYNAFRFDKTLS